MERDYIIRIILEAQDRMSKTMRQAASDAKREIREVEAAEVKAEREREKRARAEEKRIAALSKLTSQQAVQAKQEAAAQERFAKTAEERAHRAVRQTQIQQAADEQIARERMRTAAQADALATKTFRNEGLRDRERITRRKVVEREHTNALKEDIERTRASQRAISGLRGRLGDLVRGYESATKSGERYTRQQVRQENALFRLARNFKSGDSNARIFSARFLMLGPIIYLAVGALYAFGTQLVSIGASAIFAAGALGGMATALIAQVLPAVGLVAAAFHRVGSVMEAVKAQQGLARQQFGDAHKDASQANDDAWALARAHEAVKDAMQDQSRAAKDLADARRSARRDIVDAINSEKDANLNLRDAELSLLEAKENLRQEQEKARGGRGDIEDARLAVQEAKQRLSSARSGGDVNEILNATSAMDFANRSLQTAQSASPESKLGLSRAKLGVDQAQQNLKESRISQGRQQVDTRETLKKGVEGSDQVVSALRSVTSANRALRDAQHQVAVSMRRSTDAASAYSAAQRNLDFILKDLTPAERRLYQAINNLRDHWKKVGRTFTDPIIDALADVAGMFDKLLDNPAIQTAGRKLGEALGGGIREFGKFLSSKEMQGALVFFMDSFRKNLPAIESIAQSLVKIFFAVAKAATPMTQRLLTSFSKWLDDLATKAGSNKGMDRMEKFFATAGTHLRAWSDLALSILHLLGALTGGAAKSGLESVKGITDEFNRWADWLNDNPDKVHDFFESSRRLAALMFQTIIKLGAALGPLFDPENMREFTEFMENTMAPALHNIAFILASLIKAFNALTHVPVLGWLIATIAPWGIAFGILSKWIPVIRRLKEGITAVIGTKLVSWLKRVAVGSAGTSGSGGAVGATGGLVGALKKLRVGLNTTGTSLLKTIGLTNDFKGGLLGKAGLIGAALAAGIAIGTLANKYLHLSDKISDAALQLTNFIGLTGDEEKRAASREKIGAKGVAYIARVRRSHQAKGMTAAESLEALKRQFPNIDIGSFGFSGEHYAKGGQIGRSFAGGGWPGGARAIPITAHEGEWIMNPPQITGLASNLGVSVKSLRDMIFGRKSDNFGNHTFTGKLRDITDSFGKMLHFAQTANGSYGQVGANWANKIERTARRHDLSTTLRPYRKGMGKFGSPAGFARGGIVGARMPTFAAGGIVTTSPNGTPSKTINQNFTINTSEVAADADYVMRVGAQHAQEAF